MSDHTRQPPACLEPKTRFPLPPCDEITPAVSKLEPRHERRPPREAAYAVSNADALVSSRTA